MKRVAETELMDDPQQARAYADADMAAAHDAFVARFRAQFPQHRPRRVLDLGCGSADVTIRFARAYPECRIAGIDAAAPMLACGAAAVAAAGLIQRIELISAYLAVRPIAALPLRAFDTVISNSLLHHLHDPRVLWAAFTHYAASGAALLAMDLRRPASIEAAADLVQAYAHGAPEMFRQDFYRSLCAAYEVAEVRAQLNAGGLSVLNVEAVGDRHLCVYGVCA